MPGGGRIRRALILCLFHIFRAYIVVGQKALISHVFCLCSPFFEGLQEFSAAFLPISAYLDHIFFRVNLCFSFLFGSFFFSVLGEFLGLSVPPTSCTSVLAEKVFTQRKEKPDICVIFVLIFLYWTKSFFVNQTFFILLFGIH